MDNINHDYELEKSIHPENFENFPTDIEEIKKNNRKIKNINKKNNYKLNIK